MQRVQTALAWVLLLPAVVLAAPERSFTELLPEKTVGYFEAQALTDAERKQAVAYRCLEEPEMRRVLDRLMAEEGNFSRAAIPMGRGMLRARADIRESGAAFDIEFDHPKGTEKVRFRDNLALAWVGFGEGGPFGIDAVAALQVDGDAANAYRFARRLMATLQRSKHGHGHQHAQRAGGQRQRPIEEYEHAGISCTEADLGDVRLHFAAVGQRLVVATRRARLTDVIDRSKSPAESSFASSKRMAEVRKHASGDGTIVMLLHLNVDYGVEQLAGRYPQLAALKEQLKMVGLGGLRAITSTSRADGAGVAGTTSVLIDGRRSGMARLFEQDDAAKFGTLGFAPKQTLYVASGRFNPPAILRGLSETAGMLVSTVGQGLYAETGINLFEDIVNVIGPEAAFVVSSNEGLIPDVGLMFESKDAARLERTILKALTRIPWEKGTGVFPTKLAGCKAHVVKIFHPRLAEVPIAPTLGVVDGHLVAALYPISFQRFVNTKRGLRPGIDKNPDYVELRKRVPAGALSLSYLDLQSATSTVYDTMIPLLQALPQDGGVTPIYEMPEASLFTKHLYGRIAWRVADERGMHWHSHSSVDLGPIMMGVVGGTAGALTAMGTVRQEERVRPVRVRIKGAVGGNVDAAVPPREAKVRDARRCGRNVRELLQVLRFYQKRNGALPDSLEAVAKEWVTARTLEVPGHPGKAYVYYGPGGKGRVLLAGLPNGPEGRICVITTDMKIARVSPRDLQALLAPSGTKK